MHLDAARYPLVPGVGSGPVVVGGEGRHLVTADGRRILDAAGGAIVANVGYGRTEIAERMAEAAGGAYVLPTWPTPERIALVTRLQERWLPSPEWRALLVSGGSESVDAALRLARHHHLAAGRPSRWKVIGRSDSYHGMTLATLAVGGHRGRRASYEPMLVDLPKAPSTLGFADGVAAADAVGEVIEREDPDTVAAVIAEPVVGSAAGAVDPPPGYWPRLREICDAHGVLLVSDEVMTGFGRLGTPFGVGQWDVVPDVIVGGKGLAGGYAPMGGVFAAPHVVEPLAAAGEPIMFFTFSAHPVACVAADTVLDILEREELVARAATQGEVLRKLLADRLLGLDGVASLHGIGLMQGVRLEGVNARDVVAQGVERDVWFYPAGGGGTISDAVMFGPAFTITDDELAHAVDVLAESITAARPGPA